MTDTRIPSPRTDRDPFELLRPFLHHADTCAKWRDGWWNNAHDCDCGLEAALIEFDERVLYG